MPRNTKLTWIAEYADGTRIPQYQGEESISTEKLDRAGLRQFIFVDDKNNEIHKTEFEVGDRFIYRLRTAIDAGTNEPRERIHIVGRVDKHDQRKVEFLFENEAKLLVGDFAEGNNAPKWIHPVTERACDLLIIS